MTDQPVTERPKMRAGMSLDDRLQLRAAILEQALTEARNRAAEAHLSVRCLMHQPHRTPYLSEAQRRLEHVKCNGESIGDGCLCIWHDEEIEPAP